MIPLLIGCYYSFTNYNFYKTKDFVGLSNYAHLMKDTLFWKSMGNTFVYAAGTIVPQLIIGLLFAALLNMSIRGRVFARASIYLPNVLSMVAVSMIWLWIYEPSLGIANRFLETLGFGKVQWLFNPSTAMLSIILMSIWKSVGYNMIVYLAGLQSIPASLYEAAELDGASKLQQFLHVTIPMLRPTTFFLFVTACVNSFTVFEQVNIMTNGGPLNSTTTIVHQIYLRGFQDFRMGYASAMAMFLMLVVLGITILNFRFGKQGNDTDMD